MSCKLKFIADHPDKPHPRSCAQCGLGPCPGWQTKTQGPLIISRPPAPQPATAPQPLSQGVAQALPLRTPSRQDRWDLRYLRLAAEVAQWSKDPSTKVGAVLVRENNTILGTGFNGFPPGEDDDPKLYADRTYKYAHVVHAERNALMHASTQDVRGSTLYTSFPCCKDCMRLAGSSGVARIVFPPLPREGRSADWVGEWEAEMGRAFLVSEEFRLTVSIRHV